MNHANGNIRAITSRELYALGVQNIAYVKKVEADGIEAYAMHAADGTQLGLMASRELAFATLKQHDLEPASVH